MLDDLVAPGPKVGDRAQCPQVVFLRADDRVVLVVHDRVNESVLVREVVIDLRAADLRGFAYLFQGRSGHAAHEHQIGRGRDDALTRRYTFAGQGGLCCHNNSRFWICGSILPQPRWITQAIPRPGSSDERYCPYYWIDRRYRRRDGSTVGG